MVLYHNPDGSIGIGPDYVRLKFRFEVTNGVSDANDDNLKMRRMSYCMNLGPIPGVQNLITKHKLPINLIKWYDPMPLLDALAIKYTMPAETI